MAELVQCDICGRQGEARFFYRWTRSSIPTAHTITAQDLLTRPETIDVCGDDTRGDATYKGCVTLLRDKILELKQELAED